MTTFCLCSLCADVPIATIPSVFPLLTVTVSVHPLGAPRPRVDALSSPRVLRLLCYLLSVELDATGGQLGVCVSQWKRSFRVHINLPEGVLRGSEVGRQAVAPLSAVGPALLLGFLCLTQIQRHVVHVRVQSLQQYVEEARTA